MTANSGRHRAADTAPARTYSLAVCIRRHIGGTITATVMSGSSRT